MGNVTFGDLTIIEYPIILGDNPACTGCPITIGWDPIGKHTRNLELYEYTRTQSRLSRRKLVIPVQKRSQMLLDAGYTQDQIIKRALNAYIRSFPIETTLNIRLKNSY